MKDSLSLGRVAGVPVGLNWSVLVIAALLVYTLATEVFPSAAPGLGDGVYLVMATVGSLLFLVSILLHELGHAMQARRDGMEIDGITLWLFGGVARFRGSFRTAGAEARIAIAGPLVSLVIGAALLGASYLPGLPASVETVWAWLGLINLALLLFNLLPALPLDGGRVLRAALWQRTGDLRRATRWAAVTAAVIAYAMVAGGLAVMILDDLVSGLWLAFIGWFLLQAAAAEGRAASRRPARALRVGDVIARRPRVTHPADSIAAFLRGAGPDGEAADRHRDWAVVADERAVGLITVAAALRVPPAERVGARVADHMTALNGVPAVRADDDLAAAVMLLRLGTGRAVVHDGGRLVGVLQLDEIVGALERRGAGAVGP